MKIKALIAVLVGAVAFQNASAGDWCPPACEDKCPVDCCDELPGSISVGYETDYIFYGNRLAGDSVWADVNYTFDIPCVGLPLTVGVWHLTSLSSGTAGSDVYGDETDLYASIALPSFCGFDASLGYTHYYFPTFRAPSQNPATGTGTLGDSQNEISLEISREIFCGVTLSYRVAHDFNAPGSLSGWPSNNSDTGAWIHTMGLSKTLDITDCIALDLSGGVLYTDNYWSNGTYTQPGRISHSGWNSYYIQAALPIAVGKCATLTPYIGYNGSPDTWVADGLDGFANPGAPTPPVQNANDVLHGGVSISVGF